MMQEQEEKKNIELKPQQSESVSRLKSQDELPTASLFSEQSSRVETVSPKSQDELSEESQEDNSDEKEELFRCNECDLNFASEKALKIHLIRSARHTGLQTECHYCHYVFRQPSKLRSHLEVCKAAKAAKSEQNNNIISRLENLENSLQTSAVAQAPVVNQIFIQNNTVNNNLNINLDSVMDRIPPVKSEDILRMLKEANYESYDSPVALGAFIGHNYLKNRMITTNVSRNVIAWKDNNNIIKDKNGLKISQKITNIGAKNAYEINKKIKDFYERMDLTNIAQTNNINNKVFTLDAIKSQDIDFCTEMGKEIVKHSKDTLENIKKNKKLPDVGIEHFKSKVKAFFDAYGSPLVRHGINSFIDHFMFTFGFNKKKIQKNCDFYNLDNMLRQKDINFFALGSCGYFLNDSESVYIDSGCTVISEMLLTFMKSNILKNAENNNKAVYFKFDNEDLTLLCDKPNFTRFVIEKLKEFF